MFYIVGLGNPGEEYQNTRHNVGRMMVVNFIKQNLPSTAFAFNKKLQALITEGKVGSPRLRAGEAGRERATLILPETFMNKSGQSVKPLITSKKKAESLIVINDDLDLPLGRFKITFNRGSGGHKGVESIIRAIKTEAFIRIKVGISPATPSGKIRKPDHKKILDFIIGPFKKSELDILKKVSKKVSAAIEMIIMEGKEKAMGEFNSL
ncbi:MAG TPA: aminoacyl-tRNA hydrolase [Candidatus Paceibacterota bacterium]|nr:aminoacyl-tRNA hydrolase [Candidatus Paceibacterota bacterium]